MNAAILALFGIAVLIGLFIVPFWAENLFEVDDQVDGKRLTRLAGGLLRKLKQRLDRLGQDFRRGQPAVRRAFPNTLARVFAVTRDPVLGEDRFASGSGTSPQEFRHLASTSLLLQGWLETIEQDVSAGRYQDASALARAIEHEARFLQGLALLTPGCRRMLELLLSGLRDENKGLKADLVARVRRHVERNLQDSGHRLAQIHTQRATAVTADASGAGP